MNSKYEKTLDENFDKALELCSNSYFYDDLIEFLKNGNIPEKQFAALEISELKNQEEKLEQETKKEIKKKTPVKKKSTTKKTTKSTKKTNTKKKDEVTKENE